MLLFSSCLCSRHLINVFFLIIFLTAEELVVKRRGFDDFLRLIKLNNTNHAFCSNHNTQCKKTKKRETDGNISFPVISTTYVTGYFYMSSFLCLTSSDAVDTIHNIWCRQIINLFVYTLYICLGTGEDSHDSVRHHNG
jgi:hypothetical protein